MKEYIERDRLYELGYWHGATPTLDNPFPDGVDAVDTKDIDSITAADVREVKRGRWVEFETDAPPRRNVCSECGYTTNPWLAHVYNFCPNCGAKMEES